MKELLETVMESCPFLCHQLRHFAVKGQWLLSLVAWVTSIVITVSFGSTSHNAIRTCGDEEVVLNKAVDDMIGYQEEPVDGQLMKFLVGWLIVYWHHSENHKTINGFA